MIKLIQYEAKKMFSSSFFIITLILLLIINIFFCADYTKARDNSVKRPLLEAVFEEYQKDPDAFLRGYEELLQYYEEASLYSNVPPPNPYRFGGSTWGITDWELYEEVLEKTEAETRYQNKLSSIISQANGIRKGLSDKDSYNYRYQTDIIRIYSSLKEKVSFQGDLIFSWDLLFSYENDFFPMVLVVILSTVYIALCDKQTGFYSISGTCKKGRGTTVAAKLVFSLFLALLFVLLFSLSSLITVGTVNGGYSTPLEAVQAIQKGYSFADMMYFPFAMNMWQAYLFSMFFKWLGMSVLSMFAFAVVMLTKRIGLALLCSGGMAVLQYYLPEWSSLSAPTQWLQLSLRSLFVPNDTISRYRTVALFDNAIDLNIVLYVLFVLSFLLVLLFSIWLYPRRFGKSSNQRLKADFFDFRNRLFLGNRPCRTFSISFFEVHKSRALVLLILVFILLKMWMSFLYYQPDHASFDQVYKSYIDNTYGGNYSEEKAELINNSIDRYQEITAHYNDMNEKFFEGKISAEEYNRYLREYSAAETKLRVLNLLRKQADHLGDLYQKSGIVGSFVYDTGYSRLMMQGADLILICCTCLVAMQQALCEFRETTSGSKMYTLIRSTKHGRTPVFWRKLIFSISCTAFLWCLHKGFDLFFLLKNFDLPDLNVPLLSLMEYAGTSASISIREYLLFTFAFSFLGTILLSTFAFLIAFFVKKRFLVYALSVLTIIIPYFVAATGVQLATYFDLTMLHNTDLLFREHHLLGFLLFFGIFASITVIGTIYARKKIKEGTI